MDEPDEETLRNVFEVDRMLQLAERWELMADQRDVEEWRQCAEALRRVVVIWKKRRGL